VAIETFRCGKCEYWSSQQVMGVCHLYPLQQTKHETDWCGQFKLLQIKSVYNINTDEFVSIPRVKRKYTKKSNVQAT
jgi:hypothetical protein